MALVLSVIAATIKLGSILKVSGSISTNTGLAFSEAIVSAVDIKVKGGVIISSSGWKYSTYWSKTYSTM